MITDDLSAAYRATEFHIQGRNGPFVMKIGEYSHAASLQKGSPSANCGIFMTAHNPFSVIKSKAENDSANGRLAWRLCSFPARGNQRDSMGTPGPIKMAHAFGRDPTGRYPDEQGFFFTWGPPVEYILPFALEFEQNAFVYLPDDGIPQLIEVDHVSRRLHSSTSNRA